MTRNRLGSAGATTLVFLLLANCSDSPTSAPVVVGQVAISPSTRTVTAGTTLTLEAIVRDADGRIVQGVPVRWSSIKPHIASVSQAGVVTALQDGEAGIVATAGDISAEATITVVLPVSRISLEVSALDMAVDETHTIAIAPRDKRGKLHDQVTATWTSSAPEIVDVTGNAQSGTIRGIVNGTATVTIAVEGITANITVNVGKAAPVVGLWDFVRQIPGRTYGTCSDTGTFLLERTGIPIGGLLQQSGKCTDNNTSDLTATLSSGTHNLSRLRFIVQESGDACVYDGTMNPARMTISGTVTCGKRTGTWTARREMPPVKLEVAKAYALRDIPQSFPTTASVTLYTGTGRAYLRPVTWTIDNPQIELVPFGQTASLKSDAANSGTLTVQYGSLQATTSVSFAKPEFVSVAIHGNTTCASSVAGAVFCWNHLQQVPARLAEGPPLGQLSIFEYEVCGLDTSGQAYCFDRRPPSAQSFKHVLSSLPFVRITTGLTFDGFDYDWPFDCGLTETHDAYCWGHVLQFNGEVFSQVVAESPIAFMPHLKFQSLSAGWDYVCGVSLENDVWCSGNNYSGRLGNGSPEGYFPLSKVDIDGVKFAKVGTSKWHTCAISTDGDAYCWGQNTYRQIGAESQLSALVPFKVPGENKYSEIAVGGSHTCGLTISGEAYCWGGDYNGQLGSGNQNQPSANTPRKIAGSHRFTAIASGATADHTCGITTDKQVVCWGRRQNLGKPGLTTNGPVSVFEM